MKIKTVFSVMVVCACCGLAFAKPLPISTPVVTAQPVADLSEPRPLESGDLTSETRPSGSVSSGSVPITPLPEREGPGEGLISSDVLQDSSDLQPSKTVSSKPVVDLLPEVQQAIDDIRAQSRGNVLQVECNGAFGYSTIQSAIDATVNGDTVVVLPRNFAGIDCTGDAYVEQVRVDNKLITVQSLIPSNPDYVSHTIIAGTGPYGPSAAVAIYIPSDTGDVYFQGFTITNIGWGAKLSSHLVLEDCVIHHCGIGLSLGGLDCTIRNCRIKENSYAGVLISGQGILVDHCFIENNESYYLAGLNVTAGAVLIHGSVSGLSDVVIQDSTIRNNTAHSQDHYDKAYPAAGGGIYAQDTILTITDTLIEGNRCTHYSGSQGGKLYSYGGGIRWMNRNGDPNARLTVTNCTIRGNSADSSGGISFSEATEGWYDESTVIIQQSSIVDNDALTQVGGGMGAYVLNAIIRDSLICGNTSVGGGAGIASVWAPQISNCTIINNSVTPDSTGTGKGAGVYIYAPVGDPAIPTIIQNSILWGNVADSGSQLCISKGDGDSYVVNVDFSDVQGGQSGTLAEGTAIIDWGVGNINADPLFAADGYHLQRRSPCRNAGDPAYVPSPGETDIDGEMRVFGGRVDMGADEWQPIMIPPEDVSWEPIPVDGEPIELPPGHALPLP